MGQALIDVEEIPLKMPDGMITVRIDPLTGKRASVNQENAMFEVFRVENVPKETVSAQRPPATALAGEAAETRHSGANGALEVDPF